MGASQDSRYRALADPKRRHLLRVLDDAGRAMDAGELSRAIGLHENTVRDHLAILVDANLVVRRSERRSTPGRPRILFSPVSHATRSPGSDSYRFLADVLANSLQAVGGDATSVAEEAGRAWGRTLVDGYGSGGADPVVARDAVVDVLDDLGFAPDPAEDRINLHDCAFRELVSTQADIVCSVHLGLIRGMAEELGGGLTIEGLEPLAAPSLCIARTSMSGTNP